MYQNFNQFPKTNNLGPDRSQNFYQGPYLDGNQNAFSLFDNVPLGFKSNPEDENDVIQVPHHIKSLFSSGEKQPLDNKNNTNFPNGPFAQVPNSFLPHHLQQNQGFPSPFFNQNNPMFPYDQPNSAQAIQKDNSSSNLSGNSRTMSINNTSQDTSHRVDSNTSGRRNGSSKANTKSRLSFQKTVNEDISLIEKIDALLNQITLNHNKVCPFCGKFINIKKCNFQNISAFLSQSQNRYYLTHFDCYLKSRTDENAPRISNLFNLSQASIQTIQNSPTIDSKIYKKVGRKPYFVTVEGFQPISSYLLFKIDRVCYALEHTAQHNQLLHIDLSKKSTSVFEPKMFMLPFNEFRVVVTIYHHSEEEPYIFEFLIDLSKLNLASEQPEYFIEANYNEENNQIKLEAQIVCDPTSDLKNHMTNSMSLDQSSGTLTAGKPEFGRNIFLVLKQVSTSLPLVRQEAKRGSITSSEGNPFGLMPQRVSSQNKLSNKLNLTPDAPLFGNASPNTFNRQQQMQPQSPGFLSQNNMVISPGLKAASSNFRPQNMNAQVDNKGNYYNAPLFPKNFQLNQNARLQFEQDNTQANNETLIPPGLIGNFNGDRNFPSQPYFAQQYLPQNNQNKVEQRETFEQNNFQQPSRLIIPKIGEGFENAGYTLPERSQTPDNMQQNDNDNNSNRGRIKGPVANLYTEVLINKARRDSSLSNSPSVSKIQKEYFSGVSTPRSEYDSNPISSNTFFPRFPGSYNEIGGEENNSASLPLTDDMVESFKIEDYRGKLVEFAKSYHGSRILQKFFPKANQQEIDLVIQEIEDKMEELMLDPYANYMFQTLAQSCSSEQRFHLLQKIAPSMVRVAQDRKGTHSLQAIISLINRDVEDKFIRQTLEGHILGLAFDAQATHLIQKLITSISIENIDFIYEPIIEKFVEVANNSFGLCVLKQLMTKVEKVPELRQKIIQLLHQSLENLIQNPYGNYAVQHALEIYPKECEQILDKIIEKIVQYSNQKFSSNVIERCFVNTTPEYKKKFVTEITKSERLLELMKNKYGNYVILKILSTAESEEKKVLAQSLLKNVNAVNVPKYKNYWIHFLEENPLKIQGLVAQTVRPSLFKPSGNYSDNGSEANSPRTADGWSHDSSKKGFPKDEKSQFYHERNKMGPMPNHHNVNHGWDYHQEDFNQNRDKYNNQHASFEVKNFRNDNNDNQAGGTHYNQQKKSKNFNQKFYEKYTNTNKNGYNNFY